MHAHSTWKLLLLGDVINADCFWNLVAGGKGSVWIWTGSRAWCLVGRWNCRMVLKHMPGASFTGPVDLLRVLTSKFHPTLWDSTWVPRDMKWLTQEDKMFVIKHSACLFYTDAFFGFCFFNYKALKDAVQAIKLWTGLMLDFSMSFKTLHSVNFLYLHRFVITMLI